MKGIILAGGLGSRLGKLTQVTNKHLLPVYNLPMIWYPLKTLSKAGIKEVMVIVSGPHAGAFLPLLKNGEEFGFSKLLYGFQERPDGGIADALSIAEPFAGKDPVAVILGDNTTDADISGSVKSFDDIIKSKSDEPPVAQIFLKKVSDPKKFGVAVFNEDNKLVRIDEKPESPASEYAVTGLYFYDFHVFKFIKQCVPSKRGELEITDINNLYLKNGNLRWVELGGFWQDAGSYEALLKANEFWGHRSND